MAAAGVMRGGRRKWRWWLRGAFGRGRGGAAERAPRDVHAYTAHIIVVEIYDDLISRRVNTTDAEKFAEICPCPCNGFAEIRRPRM
jgi:hypothetical protein